MKHNNLFQNVDPIEYMPTLSPGSTLVCTQEPATEGPPHTVLCWSPELAYPSKSIFFFINLPAVPQLYSSANGLYHLLVG